MSQNDGPTPTVLAVDKLHLEGKIGLHSFFTRPEFKSDSARREAPRKSASP